MTWTACSDGLEATLRCVLMSVSMFVGEHEDGMESEQRSCHFCG
ncbi:hypothetical protein [Adlercreutzia caecimuris]|nr:hypothetical protein [Adlercreutzia caecimuris]